MTKIRRRIQRGFARYLYVFLGLGLAYRLLFGTLWGVLLFALALYFIAPIVSTIEPLGPTGLLDWYAGLSTDSQAAVATGLLTTVGFVAAFWAAYAAWQRQLEIQIRMAVADDLNLRFSAVQNMTNRLHGHLVVLQESITESLATQDPDEKAIALFWVNSQAEVVSGWQRELHEARMNYWGVIGRSGYVLACVRNGWTDYERVGRLIQKAADNSHFWWPRANRDDPNFVKEFLRQVDTKALQRAIVSCERVNTEGSAVIGSLRGKLTQGTMRVRFATVSQITERRKFLAKIFTKYLAR